MSCSSVSPASVFGDSLAYTQSLALIALVPFIICAIYLLCDAIARCCITCRAPRRDVLSETYGARQHKQHTCCAARWPYWDRYFLVACIFTAGACVSMFVAASLWTKVYDDFDHTRSAMQDAAVYQGTGMIMSMLIPIQMLMLLAVAVTAVAVSHAPLLSPPDTILLDGTLASTSLTNITRALSSLGGPSFFQYNTPQTQQIYSVLRSAQNSADSAKLQIASFQSDAGSYRFAADMVTYIGDVSDTSQGGRGSVDGMTHAASMAIV